MHTVYIIINNSIYYSTSLCRGGVAIGPEVRGKATRASGQVPLACASSLVLDPYSTSLPTLILSNRTRVWISVYNIDLFILKRT